MQITREVKVSDDNYGNDTKRLSIEVEAGNLVEASFLMDRWAELVRMAKTISEDSRMTVAEMRLYEKTNEELTAVLQKITEIAV